MLAVTGVREADLAGIGEGLAYEFSAFLKSPSFRSGVSAYAQGGLDRACGRPSALTSAVTLDGGVFGALRYARGWFCGI